ncbi:nucleoside phosphorylase domain-containing protein [Aspergillus insuetus]
MGGHYIVIAYLPDGVYEAVSAAAVVSRMRLTFPRLQFGQMVEIGGGLPSKSHDIRLGDIVISQACGKHGGVIQYDYGKAIQGGLLERIGALNKPPHTLLTQISRLRANWMASSECTKENLVNREPRAQRTPYIHFGLIASGDRVMKDSETRDRLAQEHGILCFEMEAAGLMDELPTLVTRGICGYCDSHKQKQ